MHLLIEYWFSLRLKLSENAQRSPGCFSSHPGERLISPSRLRPVHRAVKLNQFPARIRHLRARQNVQTAFPARIRPSRARQKVQTAFPARIRPSRARHFATNCRPGTSIHPQTLLTDRFEVHFTALARVFGHSEWYRCRRRDETAGFRGFREVSVPKEGRDCWFPGILCGLGAGSGTRLSVSGDSEWSRCRKWDETVGFRGFRVVSVSEVGRDHGFSVIPSGLGAKGGTRLSVSGDSARSRCRRWDETAGFRSFRVVSVQKEGRDYRFSGNPRGLGAGEGTRPLVFGHSEWSRCLKWDETVGFRGFRVVSVLEGGRDLRFSGIPSGLGAREGTRLRG